jgi:hypothetical protein
MISYTSRPNPGEPAAVLAGRGYKDLPTDAPITVYSLHTLCFNEDLTTCECCTTQVAHLVLAIWLSQLPGRAQQCV